MNVTLRTKLLLAFAAILILMGLMAGIAISQLYAVTQIARDSYTHGQTSIKIIGDNIPQHNCRNTAR